MTPILFKKIHSVQGKSSIECDIVVGKDSSKFVYDKFGKLVILYQGR